MDKEMNMIEVVGETLLENDSKKLDDKEIIRKIEDEDDRQG